MEGQPKNYWKNWSDKDMEALANKKTVTSRELLEQINIFREQEGKPKMKHKTLLDIIRKELYKEINEQKLLPISYIDTKNRKKPMYSLTFSQGKRVLLRESPTVRQAVIEYIDKLENAIIQLQEQRITEARYLGKITRKLETDSIKGLMEGLSHATSGSITSIIQIWLIQ